MSAPERPPRRRPSVRVGSNGSDPGSALSPERCRKKASEAANCVRTPSTQSCVRERRSVFVWTECVSLSLGSDLQHLHKTSGLFVFTIFLFCFCFSFSGDVNESSRPELRSVCRVGEFSVYVALCLDREHTCSVHVRVCVRLRVCASACVCVECRPLLRRRSAAPPQKLLSVR